MIFAHDCGVLSQSQAACHRIMTSAPQSRGIKSRKVDQVYVLFSYSFCITIPLTLRDLHCLIWKCCIAKSVSMISIQLPSLGKNSWQARSTRGPKRQYMKVDLYSIRSIYIKIKASEKLNVDKSRHKINSSTQD